MSVCAGGGGGAPSAGSVQVPTTSSTKEMLAFSILGNAGVIVGTNIGITLPYGTSVTSLIVDFTSNGTSVTVNSTSQTSTVTPNDFTNPVTYIVHAEDGSTKSYIVTVAVALNSAKDITAYSILGNTGVIVGTNIGVTVPFGTNVTNLVATFTSTGASVTLSSSTQTTGVTSNDFTNPVTYTVTAANGTTKNYSVTVTVALNPSKDISALSILGNTGSIVGTNIGVTVPFGTDVTTLVATYSTTGASVTVNTTIQVSGASINDFTSPVTYVVHAADGTTKSYTVTVTVASNTAKDITAYSILGNTGVIVGTNIGVTVPYGTSVTSLTATFVTTGASVTVASTTQVSGSTSNNFTSPVTYVVHAADSSTKSYTVTVKVFGSTTATRVYGQWGSFATSTANNGGVSSNSLSQPSGLAFNTDGLYVADTLNNRVLYYTGISTSATRVYGQLGSFTTSTANNGGISSNSLNGPQVIAIDADGLYVADTFNNRVLYYTGTSTTATRVYGQSGSFTTNAANKGGISEDSLDGPSAVTVDTDGVYIADWNNNRVLYFNGTSTTASRVYGQGGNFGTITANNGGISADSLYGPITVTLDVTGIYITDSNNSRVLYYTGTSTTATRVYGQGGSFTTNTDNNGGISADSLSYPGVLVLDEIGVFICDQNNSRVLYYTGTSTTATRVYGQGGSFTTNTSNKGGISVDSLNYPALVTVDVDGVYISDMINNRVLFY